MKKFLKFHFFNSILLSWIIVIIPSIQIFANQDYDSVTDEQAYFFLKQWPECTASEDTKKACNDEMSKVRNASPRVKRTFFQVIDSYQGVAIKAGNNSDQAKKKTEDDLSNFLKTEFSVDVPEEVDPEKYPELIKFIKKYGLPHIFAKEAKKFEMSINRDYITKVEELPNFFIKGSNIARIINAERIRRCIEVNNLDQLDVPKKYLEKVGNLWRIFAERIDPSYCSGEKFSLKETQQLTILAEETGFRDWDRYNFRRDEHNKLICIDTENNSFKNRLGYENVKTYSVNKTQGIKLPPNCKANYVMYLWDDFHDRMNAEAQEWLKHRIEELLHSPEGTAEDTPIFANKKYDDPEIDFEKVKEELKELNIKYKINDNLWQAFPNFFLSYATISGISQEYLDDL